MNYLLDTNILLIYLRENKGLATKIDRHFAPFDAPNVSILSVVSIGEIRSIAIQSQWGNQRMKMLENFISKFPVADIHV